MIIPARIGRVTVGCLALLMGPGCRSPQIPLVYHQLHPLAEASSGTHVSLKVEVLPVRLPGMLRRQQLVLPGPAIFEAHLWANGLEQDMQRALVGNLALLLGSEKVVAYPDGEGMKGVHRVMLDVEQWGDGGPAGTLAFRATWMLRKDGLPEPLGIHKVRLDEPLKDSSPEALVAAQERILLALSKAMAAELIAQN